MKFRISTSLLVLLTIIIIGKFFFSFSNKVPETHLSNIRDLVKNSEFETNRSQYFHNAYIVQFAKVHKTGGTTLFALFQRLQFLINSDRHSKFLTSLGGSIFSVVRSNIRSEKSSTFLFEAYHLKPHQFQTLKTYLPHSHRELLRRDFKVKFHDIRIGVVREPTNLLISRLDYTNHYGAQCLTGENINEIFEKTKIFNISEQREKTGNYLPANNTGVYSLARCLDQIRNVLCLDLIPACVRSNFHYAPYEQNDRLKGMINKLNNYFDFVVITEHFDASLLLLSDMLEIDFYILAYIPTNIRRGSEIYSDSYRSEIKRFQKVDYVLYENFLGRMIGKLTDKYGNETVSQYLTTMKAKQEFTIRHTNTILKTIAIFRLLKQIIMDLCVSKKADGTYRFYKNRVNAGRYVTNSHALCLIQKLHTHNAFTSGETKRALDKPYLSLKKFNQFVLGKIEQLSSSSKNEADIVKEILQSNLLDNWGK
ncbi:hypothetical protein SNEBB_009017 [Seison nebaliae]|nr:hypothetical protein SNEBB_009017 [Seison nebaliae]